jgi:hypothetical protein
VREQERLKSMGRWICLLARALGLRGPTGQHCFRLAAAIAVCVVSIAPSRAADVSDKTAFFQRWPVRNYSLVADSLRVECETSSHAMQK